MQNASAIALLLAGCTATVGTGDGDDPILLMEDGDYIVDVGDPDLGIEEDDEAAPAEDDLPAFDLEVLPDGERMSIDLALMNRPVRPAADGTLEYHPDGDGDRIPDFSHAGYGGGGVALPHVAGPVEEVSPGPGDDLARIQGAIDRVAALPPDARGIRGVVLLRAGTYQVRGGKPGHGRMDHSHIVIDASGIILRGEGAGGGAGNTTLEATSKASFQGQRVVIEVGIRGSEPHPDTATRRDVTDHTVPVGARRLRLSDVSPFHAGDRVIVRRRAKEEWIDRIGMDACSNHGTALDVTDHAGTTCLPNHTDWRIGLSMELDRVVTAVDPATSTIAVDAPMPQALERNFDDTDVTTYTFPRRISQVGIERIRGVSAFDRNHPDDHAWNFIVMESVENAWVRNVTAVHFAHSTVRIMKHVKWVTVQDSEYLRPISKIQGGHRYPFQNDGGQLVLFQRCTAEGGRHSFVFGNNVLGPNVFLDCHATGSFTSSETHNQWTVGALYDNVSDRPDPSVVGRNPIGITVRNEGATGSGHGWSGANSVVWNSDAPVIHVSSPPSAQNWALGCDTPRARGNARWYSINNPVMPHSLYRAQLRDRLGAAALDALD